MSIGGNNLDDPEDHRDLNLMINNYVVNEFVAIPPNFDFRSHLKMREQVGIFPVKEINLELLEILCDSIKLSPVFCTMNNANMNPKNCFFLLELFSELGLIVKSIDNPLRKSMNKEAYLEFCKEWEDDYYNYVRGQEVKRISITFVNLYHIFSDDIYSEVSEAVKRVETYQKEIDGE